MPSVPSTKLHPIATPTLYLTNHKFLNSQICVNMNLFSLCMSLSKIIYLTLFMMFFAIIVMCKDIHRTRQLDMIHVFRCNTKFSSRLPLHTLPIIWNKWAISAPGNFSRRRFRRHVKSTICLYYPTQVRCKNKYCRDCR